MAIENRLAHIKEKEAEARQRFGQQVQLRKLTGRTECTVCSLDPEYKTSTNPNCPVCGGKFFIPVYETYDRYVLAHWVTTEEKVEKEAGMVKVGTCEVTGDYEDKEIWENMAFNNTSLTVDGVEIRPKIVNYSSLRTKVKVTCERIKES